MAYFGRAAVASLLIAAAGAEAAPPAPAKADAWGPADVCAIAARPETPGHDETGDAAYAVYAETDWQMAGWDPEWKVSPEWGPCPVDHVRFELLYFSPDGRYAKTSGGWQAGPLEGAQGYCLFEKRKKAWDVLGCAITAIS
jgi:hypothetical protein